MKKIKLLDKSEKFKNLKQTAVEDINVDEHPPKISLEYINSKYCLSKCTKEEKIGFDNKLINISKLSWAKLRQVDRHTLGYETLNRKSLSFDIPPHLTDDIFIIAFRFHDRAAMIGFKDREHGIFYILAFDRKFKVYNH
jgi:hypothetical protein